MVENFTKFTEMMGSIGDFFEKISRLIESIADGSIGKYFWESMLLIPYSFASVGGLLCLALFVVTHERKYIKTTAKYITVWLICEGVALALCLV